MAVGDVLSAYSEAWKRSVGVGAAAGPSSALMQALLSIVSASRTIHASVLLDTDTRTAGETLRAFIGALLDSDLEPAPVQARAFVWDLRLLRKLALLWGSGWEDVVERLDEGITQFESSVCSKCSPVSMVHLIKALYSSSTPLHLPPTPTPSSPTTSRVRTSSWRHYCRQVHPSLQAARRARKHPASTAWIVARRLRWNSSSLDLDSGCCLLAL